MDVYKWLKVVEKNWIKANKQIQLEYPLNYRYCAVSNSLIQDSLPDIYRLDRELGKVKTRKFIALVEDGFFIRSENSIIESMTATKYFEYCKIAYIAGQRRESQQEFADWIDGKHVKRSGRGHPWEIKRGGNTTHIDLSVYRPSFSRKDGFIVELREI